MDEDVKPTDDAFDDGLQVLREYMVQREQGFDEVISKINADCGCDLRMTCEACPVQLEGTIDDLHVYFRSRWDSWRLAIATDLESAVRAGRMTDALFYHHSCAGMGGSDASWLEPEQLDRAVRACLTAYRDGKQNAGYVEL